MKQVYKTEHKPTHYRAGQNLLKAVLQNFAHQLPIPFHMCTTVPFQFNIHNTDKNEIMLL